MAHLETPSGTQDIHNREKESVSTLLPVQLRANSQAFIAFLEDYYEFTNQVDQPTNLIDRISNEHDLDFTSDKFLAEIKKEIASGIPESQALNDRQLFKKIIDYYYTRGSQNSAHVFFKLFFNDEVTINYPKETLFKTSDSSLNNHGFVDLNGTGERVEWSNITGDFIKPLTRIPEGGKKAVFITTTTGALDWLRGTYVYDGNTKRWNHVQDGSNRQFFVYNGAATRWEFVRQRTNFYWGFDDGEVRATEDEGFWSVIGGQTDRWKLILGGTSHSHPNFPIAGLYTGNTIPGLPQNFPLESYPDIRNFNTDGVTIPYLRTDESTKLDTATTRGNTPIQEEVVEDKRHENEYYVHYGESEGDFWEVEKQSILNSDLEGDNIGEGVELNTRHIYAEENFIKFPLYDYAYVEEEFNGSRAYIDAHSIRVEQTSYYESQSGRSTEVTIPLGKCGNDGEFFRLSGTLALLESGGKSRETGSTAYAASVYISNKSKGWEIGSELMTQGEHITMPDLTGAVGQRGFNVADGTGMVGDFEFILTRRTHPKYDNLTNDQTSAVRDAELTFVSLYGVDFKISNLRLEKCVNKFLRIPVNSMIPGLQIGDVLSTDNGSTNYTSSPANESGFPSMVVRNIIDSTNDKQDFIDVNLTEVEATVVGAVNNSNTVIITNPNYSATDPAGLTGGLIEKGFIVTWDGQPYTGSILFEHDDIRVKTIPFNQTTQTITLTIGKHISGTTINDVNFDIPDGTVLKFRSVVPLSGSAIKAYANRNSRLSADSSSRTIKDGPHFATDGVIYHKDYNKNKQLNSFWYLGNRDRSETQLRAHSYEIPGSDPEGHSSYGIVPFRLNNANKFPIVQYENLPRVGQKLQFGNKPGGRYHTEMYRYSPPYIINREGGQTWSTTGTYNLVTARVNTNLRTGLTFGGNTYTFNAVGGHEYYSRAITGGFEEFHKTNHSADAISAGAVEGTWAAYYGDSGGFQGNFGSLTYDLGKGPFPTHPTDTSLIEIQYAAQANKTGTEFLIDTLAGNQVILNGMRVNGEGITGDVFVTNIEHDETIIGNTGTGGGAIKITLDTSVTLSNDTLLGFNHENDVLNDVITKVTYSRPTFGKVSSQTSPVVSHTSGEIEIPVTITGGGIPPVGTHVQGKRIKKGSYIKAVTNVVGTSSCTIRLSDQSTTTCKIISIGGTNKKTITVDWVRGEKPNQTQWVSLTTRVTHMNKTVEGSLFKKNMDDGGLSPVNGPTKVVTITPSATYYNRFDIVLDVPQPYLQAGDYVNFYNTGTLANLLNNTPLKFSLTEVHIKNRRTTHMDGSFYHTHFRGVRPGGHYYPSESNLPFYDNRGGDEIIPSETQLIELGTYEKDTHIYGKDRDNKVFTIEAPRAAPYSTNQPGIPTDTLVFSDKHFALAGKGKDAFVLPLNMYGKTFVGINVSYHLGQFYGYALEDCTVNFYDIEQHRVGVRLGDEHRFADELRLLGPKAEVTDVLLTPTTDASYYYGRDAQTYYEVKVAGDYSKYIDDDETSVILRNNRSLHYAESKYLQVGDIFTPKRTDLGSLVLDKGLKVKAAPTETKEVKAGEKFTFTAGRHYTDAEDQFIELNTLTGSTGRYYMYIFDCTGECVIGQSGEQQTEDQMILAPAAEKTLGYRKPEGGGHYGPWALSGRESWYISDHGRSGFNGIPIESAEIIHDYTDHTRTLTVNRPYYVARGAQTTGSTNFEYDNSTVGFEDHAESLVAGMYVEIAIGTINGVTVSGGETTVTLEKVRGRISTGLEVQCEQQAASGSPGHVSHTTNNATQATVSSITAQTHATFGNYNGTATVVINEEFTGLLNGEHLGFYAKVANTPTRVSYASRRITAKSNFFDRNVEYNDNGVLSIGPFKGGITATNVNSHVDISRLSVTSAEPYPQEGMKLTGGFLGSNVRRILKIENNTFLELTGKVTCKHGDTVDASIDSYPAVMKLQTPLSHEIYWGTMQKLGKLKNLGFSGNYNPNDENTNILVGRDRDDIYIPCYSIGKVNEIDHPAGYASNTTITSNKILLNNYDVVATPANDLTRFSVDPTGVSFDDGQVYSSPYNLSMKKAPQYPIYAKIRVGMLVEEGGDGQTFSTPAGKLDNNIPTGTYVTNVISQYEIEVSQPCTLNHGVNLTFRPPAGSYTDNIDVDRIGTNGQGPPAHIEFVGVGHTVDKGNHLGHYDESIGDPLVHIHRSDGGGADAYMALPIEKLKDTYVIPHAITDWALTTIYTNKWNIFFWKVGSGGTPSQWVKYGDTINRPFNRTGVTQFKRFPDGAPFGTTTTFATDPNDSNYTPTLWKFEGDRPFFLVTNDGENDEEAVYGFNRNTYSEPQYSFYSDYKDRKGRLSDVNKIHDGNFNQEFSYGLNTTLSLDKWETQYRKLVHPSGTKFFGLLNLEANVNDSDVARRTATHESGSPTYELTVGQGIEWLNNLKLAAGQHTPKFQPGWLDEVLTALVEIEPLVAAGVTIPTEVTDAIEQALNATYRFTKTKVNGVTLIKLRTTHVETETPVTIETLNLPTFPRPQALTSVNIKDSDYVPTLNNSTRKTLDVILNPDRRNNRGGVIKPFTIVSLAGGVPVDKRDLEFEKDGTDDIMKIKLLDDTRSGRRQYHLRIHGLQSGAKYRVTGELRVSLNTLGSSVGRVQAGADISDGYVQENIAAREAGTYPEHIFSPLAGGESITLPGIHYSATQSGSTSSFTSFTVEGTYFHASDLPTIGRDNREGTHNFIDIQCRIHPDDISAEYSGAVTVEYKNLKIEEFYMGNETIFNNNFDTRVTGITTDLNVLGTTPGNAREQEYTNFTSWHNPISNLQNETFFNYSPLDVPFGAQLRAKLAGGNKPTPIFNDTTTEFSNSGFIVGETVTGQTSNLSATITSILVSDDISDGANVRLTLGSFSGGNATNFTFYSTPEKIVGSISQQEATVVQSPQLATDTLDVNETLGIRTLDFTLD